MLAIVRIDRGALKARISALEPGGATAIQRGLEEARRDFSGVFGPKLILLLTDGSETCRGDPVAAARGLIAAGYDLKINVVGFDVDGDAATRSQLRAINGVAGGLYFGAETGDGLRTALQLAATSPIRYHVYNAQGMEVCTGLFGAPCPRLAVGTYRVVIDTVPAIELTGVTVTATRATQITLRKSNGQYVAQVMPS